MDCPGHTNFHDESVAALQVVDGAVITVDAVDGIMMHTEMVVRQAISDGLPLTLLVNKVDRLIIELKLPPRDAYFKLLNIVESINVLVQEASRGRYPKLSPERGNVTFASSQHGWCFTTNSFANLYLEHYDEGGLGEHLSVNDFAKRLWGDSFLDPTTHTFHKKSSDCATPGVERTFVTLVLGPIYKIYTACLGERETDVNKLLRSVGVLLSKEQLRASTRPLLRAACSRFFVTANAGFMDMIVKHVPCPSVASKGKVARCYTGPQDSSVAKSMVACDPRGPLMIHCVKMYSSFDGKSFSTFGRIYSGTLRPGDRVRVLGEAYSPDDDEDMAMATVEAISIPRGRSRTDVTMAKAGNWVLIDGVDANISKTATITSAAGDENNPAGEDDIEIFKPLKFPQAGNESTMKLAVEPLNPAELPKMVEGLRRISKAYPMARTRVEESGEHVLFGTGELYMDCMMHDLRHVYSDIEVKVSDPVVGFRETVVETSSVKCFSETTNKRNKLTFIAEPLDDGLAEQLEAGKVNFSWDKKKIGRYFQTKYDWDLLSSRSVWAFGASPTQGTNILMDDTLPSEVDKALLNTCKSSIVQGFQWAVREGPLCEEPVRGTKIKILDAVLAEKPIHRGGGQIIPTARRTVHSALLTASPRLMEPIYRLQIQCPGEIVDAIQPILTRRRGHIVQDRPMSGSTLSSVTAFMPVLDSFGFETDLRTFTQGQAMVYSVFDHWNVVPGDPLDKSIILHPLEPSPPPLLARELLIKTRRRKGLSEDLSISKFFDDAMKAQLEKEENVDMAEVQLSPVEETRERDTLQ
jgi:U5 small nuclear ribonucleoprotein component